jgi:hypothetical protein
MGDTSVAETLVLGHRMISGEELQRRRAADLDVRANHQAIGRGKGSWRTSLSP